LHEADAGNAGVQPARNNATNGNEKVGLKKSKSTFTKIIFVVIPKKNSNKKK
jgi:hypothetical protein